MALSQQIPLLNQLATPATVAGIALVPILTYTVKYYLKWRAIPRGGLPNNILGFAIQSALQLVAKRDTIDESPFSDPVVVARYKPHGEETFLAQPLPVRSGSRPTVPGFAAPQRQMTEQATSAMKEKMSNFLHQVAAANSNATVYGPSKLEGGNGPGVFLADKVQTPAFMADLKGEVVHHHLEGSSHMVLSLTDAREAVSKGWAQRFPLGGVRAIPWTYVLIYAPRDDGELAVWKGLVVASLRFVTAGGPGINNV
ncbi:phospholipase/carboxylesterase [Dactylonectria macrodidyma]|uniref:Phospholipase/carboxylesterase n=1 Tax=Dactylonectria macrodidyma TaxID=307937 RepID=A0A9P9E5E8_9HYPO|nr:phospholipase/carboxylesterase [Dactylonectria macrodidyma]